MPDVEQCSGDYYNLWRRAGTAEVERLNNLLVEDEENIARLRVEVERLRTALLTICTANDPDAPISRKTCADVAKAALDA